MCIWNQDLFIKAWNFTSTAHKRQCLPASDIPYLNHIGNVAMEVMAVIALERTIENPDLLVQCALLHDVIEDTDTGVEELESMFGPDVRWGVAALTKDRRIPKPRRMLDCLDRIRKQPKEIWMVKMADRITNLQPPPGTWGRAKIETYRDDANLILQRLGEANGYLAQRLQNKIAEYDRHVHRDP